MKYYLDTEFHEYHKQIKVAGIKVGKLIPTIDLISIGIVSESIPASLSTSLKDYPSSEYREYYAICKDFNLKDAWYSNQDTKEKPNYWLRENVLKSIMVDLTKATLNTPELEKECVRQAKETLTYLSDKEQYKLFKELIEEYGKTKKQIIEEIKNFVGYKEGGQILTKSGLELGCEVMKGKIDDSRNAPVYNPKPVFYAYYADYDWVVFCQLFGKMNDLPDGFSQYCNDLKQIMDTEIDKLWFQVHKINQDDIFMMGGNPDSKTFIKEKVNGVKNILKLVKSYYTYPKQKNEHNALDDAKWNKKLHEFIKKL